MQTNIPIQFQENRFLVVSRLGDGGAAAVWRVVDTKYDIERAIKTLHVVNIETPLSRFEQEVKIMMRLQSPHIVTVFESFVEEERLHIVMEKCSGSLDTWRYMYGPMPARLAVQVMIQVLKGLLVAHDKGVVHRDIKPHNVLIAADGTVKLADFGLALLYLSPESLTKTGAILGSLAFMSPEQRLNPSEVTPATDIYSATMTLVWLLEGAHVGDLYLPETLSALHSKYPSGLVDIIEKGGRNRPEDRYSSAHEMIQDLKVIEGSLPETEHSLMGLQLVEVSVQDLTPTPVQPVSQHQSIELKALNSVRWMLGVVVLLLVGIAAVVLWQIQYSAQQRGDVQTSIGKDNPQVEIPMCSQPVRSFTRLTKLGPKESVQTSFEDLNRDGKMDLIFVNQYSRSLSIYWGNEDYEMQEPLEIPYARSRARPIIGDFNQDGVLDMVSSHIDLQRIKVHYGVSETEWKPPSESELTELLQIPPPNGGMAYDGNEDGVLDVYLVAQDIATTNFKIIVRSGSPESVFENHQNLLTTPTRPSLDPKYPYVYWIEDERLLKKDSLRLSQPTITLSENVVDMKLQQVIHNRKDEVEGYLFDSKGFIYRWSENEGLCQLSESSIPLNDLMYEESFGYWNDDDIVDISTTRTCMYCTSNHILFLGN